jgi:hypothetical protein
MNYTISQLRKKGYKVQVLHSRPVAYQQRIDGSVRVFAPKGGVTVINITTPTGHTVTGAARCSEKETWNRKMGNQIALGRAINQLTDI